MKELNSNLAKENLRAHLLKAGHPNGLMTRNLVRMIWVQ
jgi:hypothetical protein